MNDKNRMQIIADNITYYRKEKGVTQKELAKAVGVTPSTMTDYMKLRSAPSFGVIQKLADYFEIKKSDIDSTFKDKPSSTPTPKVLHLDRELHEPRHAEWISYGEELLKKQTDEQNTEGNSTNTVGNNVVQFPAKDDFESLIVHGLESAGDGIWQEDETDIEVRIPKSKIPEVFDDLALVIGDSMRPKLHNGDILFVTFTKQIEIGQIGLFRTSKGNFVKKLQPDRLESLNPDYEDIYFEEDEFAEAIGVVQDIYRK